MSKRDFYDVLGVSKDVDEKTLKAAYRKLAMANHPDRNQGDAASEERFREASEAYEVLKDPQKRAAYDRMGHAAFDQSAGGFGGGGLAAVVALPIYLTRCFLNFLGVQVVAANATAAAMIFVMT